MTKISLHSFLHVINLFTFPPTLFPKYFIMDPKFTGKPLPTGKYFTGTIMDIEQMPDTPNRTTRHRRAQSETFTPFDDDFLDNAVKEFNFDNYELPPFSSDNPIPTTTGDSSEKSEGESVMKVTSSIGHGRSLSVDAGFFDGLGLGETVTAARGGAYRHRHSNSMDGSITSSFEGDSGSNNMLMMIDNSKKALAPDKLAELALIDPKRAKRFQLFIYFFNNFLLLLLVIFC